MAVYSPNPTDHPTIPSGAWTKISQFGESAGRPRKLLMIWNEDTSTQFRIEILRAGVTPASLPLGATDGFPLDPAASATSTGGSYLEDYDMIATGDVYAYQASGGRLTTLGIREGV